MSSRESTRLLDSQRQLLQNSFASKEIAVTPLRWWILALYMFLGISMMFQYSYVTVIDQMTSVYGVGEAHINFCASIGSISFVILAFPGCKLCESLGLRKSLILSAVLVVIGSAFKILSIFVGPNYWLLLLGNLIASSPSAVLLGTPPLVASAWFPDSERTLATALGSTPNHLGFAANVLVSPILVNLAPSTNQKLGVIIMTLVQSAAAVLSLLLVVFSFKGAPKNPPSLTATSSLGGSSSSSTKNIIPSLIRCFKNSNFSIVALSMGIAVGLCTSYIVMMAQCFSAFGISEGKMGVMGFAAEFSGVTATVLIGLLVDKWKAAGFKKPWLVLLGGQFFFFLLLLIGAKTVYSEADQERYYVMAFICFLLAEVCIFPQYAVVMELTVETSYPEPAVIGGTTTIMGVSLWQFLGMMAFSQYLPEHPSPEHVEMVFGFLLIVVAIIFFLVLLYVKDDLVRRRVDEEGKEQKEQQRLKEAKGVQ